ncbi:hypothetical protein CAI21_16585 [Alkalilimnicola ehrlichii]|uniref:Lipoprotein n=2 Tax=Alkalilimnicola ehrlichii TaxID=351052 RepID=A0A3E0WLR7_9GAMM|nr:hypothetical protein CAI21_16585 [Alkalilimnicola ehrlichii]RFA32916.1 hypothetical protein CAL65_18410 [Alkalilimnicola ehrlichii]
MKWAAFKIVMGILGSVMLVAGCSGGKEVEQEQISVRKQFEQLEATHEARYKLLENLEDTELARLLWEEQRANYFTMLNLISFHMTPGEFQYTQPQLLRLQDYGDMAEMTEAYLQSLLAISSHQHPHCMRYSGNHGFVLREGFEFPFRYRLIYSHMVFDDGNTLQLPDVANRQQETPDVIHRGGSYCYKEVFSTDDPQPTKVRGEFHAELPDNLIEFEFSAEDIGKTIEQNGYLVTLLEFEQGRYAIEIDAVEEKSLNFHSRDVVAEAVDVHGEYIAWRATEREPTTRAHRIHKLLEELFQRAEQGTISTEDALRELEVLRDTLLEEQGRKLFLSRAFNGIVDKARITLMIYSEESESFSRELELPVYNFPRPQVANEVNLNALPQISAATPVYDARAELNASIVELDAQQMQARVRMVQWHEDIESPDLQREYTGQIGWFYPPVQSDIFMQRQDRAGALHVLGEFEFYDEQGDPVEAREMSDANSEKLAFEYKPGSLEYPRMFGRLVYSPERFTKPPVRVKGILPMIVAPNIVKDSYAIDELPAGMALNGNQLMIDYAVFEPREVAEVRDELTERRNKVFVKDANGYLTEIKKETLYHPHSGRTAVDVYYFTVNRSRSRFGIRGILRL